jgi:protein-tyrosine phosphatase
MSIFSSIFGKNDDSIGLTELPFYADMHSHLIPAIDDGSQSLEESVEMILEFKKLGYKKLITTPHINGDFYLNTPQNINAGLENLKQKLLEEKIEIEVQAAAEYYVDSYFTEKIERDELLYFGDKYVLIETSLSYYPHNFREVIFKLKLNGYKPVFAHPERYSYLGQNKKLYYNFKDWELLFQVNLMSFHSVYSPQVRKTAEFLVNENLVDMVGSDAHDVRLLQMARKNLNSPYIRKLAGMNLLNKTL